MKGLLKYLRQVWYLLVISGDDKEMSFEGKIEKNIYHFVVRRIFIEPERSEVNIFCKKRHSKPKIS